jgi:antitoxin component of RelBE/YafQ-DinJ toxin-antitoxin module
MEKTTKKLLNLKLDEDLMWKFKAVCIFEGKTMTEVVNSFINNYITENKDKIKLK